MRTIKHGTLVHIIGWVLLVLGIIAAVFSLFSGIIAAGHNLKDTITVMAPSKTDIKLEKGDYAFNYTSGNVLNNEFNAQAKSNLNINLINKVSNKVIPIKTNSDRTAHNGTSVYHNNIAGVYALNIGYAGNAGPTIEVSVTPDDHPVIIGFGVVLSILFAVSGIALLMFLSIEKKRALSRK